MADRKLMRQVEAVGRWEDKNHVPEDNRLTRWYPGFNVYTVLMGVEAVQITARYLKITKEDLL